MFIQLAVQIFISLYRWHCRYFLIHTDGGVDVSMFIQMADGDGSVDIFMFIEMAV